MKASTFLTAFLSTALIATSTSAWAGTTYTRDSKYIYIKTPLRLTLDSEQTAAIKKAISHITAELDAMDANNPRLTTIQKLDDKLIKNADLFETSLNQILQFSAKYYGDAAQYAHVHLYDAIPTGFIVFGGLEVTANLGVGGGGSVMTGIVMVPQRVQVMEIDTHKIVSDSVGFDSNLVVFPTANLGVGVGGGANSRLGVGFIWGQLDQASEFKGLLTGASASFALVTGNNFKVQTLKNWNKTGAVSNVLLTAAWETGMTEKLEAHAAVSYVIDAQSFFNSIGNGANAVGNKLGITNSNDGPDLLKPKSGNDRTTNSDSNSSNQNPAKKPVTAINDPITPTLQLPSAGLFDN